MLAFWIVYGLTAAVAWLAAAERARQKWASAPRWKRHLAPVLVAVAWLPALLVGLGLTMADRHPR